LTNASGGGAPVVDLAFSDADGLVAAAAGASGAAVL
jgi:hypothetical protein